VIANALASVPEDGTLKGHKAWFLTTALSALEPKPELRRPSNDDQIGPLWHFASRLEGWEEIHLREKPERPIGQVAAEYNVPVQTVLTWLRAGLPYLQEGDWHTGEDFVLRPAWVFDWILALSCLTDCPGQKAWAQELRLPYV